MVRQWQTLFYDKRHSETDLSIRPDFVKLSEAFGGIGYRVETKEEFDAALQDAVEKNVVAFIEGTEKPEEYIVISSHLDHVGVNAEGEVFNGADDDGSGTVSILEIAEAFKKCRRFKDLMIRILKSDT